MPTDLPIDHTRNKLLAVAIGAALIILGLLFLTPSLIITGLIMPFILIYMFRRARITLHDDRLEAPKVNVPLAEVERVETQNNFVVLHRRGHGPVRTGPYANLADANSQIVKRWEAARATPEAPPA